MNMKRKLANVQKKIDNETVTMFKLQNSINGLLDSFQNITEKAMYYRNIISSTKFYIGFIILSFILSISLQEILIPTIGLTFTYMLMEINGKSTFLYNPIFKWSYIIIYFAIIIILILNHYKYLKIPTILNFQKEKVKVDLKLVISEPVVYVNI